MKDAGLLTIRDARKWAHWWTVRGHSTRLESINRRGVVRCYLRLNR